MKTQTHKQRGNTMTNSTIKNMIAEVYEKLQCRAINPRGKFDKGGRFYAANDDLINVRSPSHAWPYSEMLACRTKKYVKKVVEKFGCTTVTELTNCV